MKNLLYFILILTISTNLYSKEKVTLQLKWFHQFQFAGYYAAKEKGFYDDVGLDVQIKQRDLTHNNIQEVIKGNAQYGVADSVLLLYKAKQEPVVLVSTIFQHSPSVLISLKKKKLSSPYELDGTDVMFYPNDTDGFAILAMFKKLGIQPNLIREKKKDDYKKLISGEFDFLPVYLTNEPFYFKQKNIPINIIDPRNYGFDLYGDMLFTSKNEAMYHPNRVKRFKEATLKGWEYALDNKEEIIQLLKQKYKVKKSVDHLRYEAQAIEEMISKKTKPLGTIDKGRIEYTYELYKDYGLTTGSFDVGSFIFEEFKDDISSVVLTKEEKEYLAKKPILKVQNMSTFAPFNFYENGIPRGYTIDYMQLVAKYLGVKVEFVSDKSWSEYLDMLRNKSIDIIPHIAINKERKKFIDFTSFDHISYQIALGVRKDSNINSIKDLKGKTLAVLDKSFMATHLKNKFPSLKLHLTKTIGEGVEAVSLGKADAVLDNIATIQYYIQKKWLSNIKIIDANGFELPKKVPLYMGVSKGNEVLKSILEKAYDKIPKNEVSNLKKKWMDVDIQEDIQLNTQELKYLRAKKELKLCIDPDWMPFEMLKDGKYIGMSADYMKILKETINTPINVVKTKSWQESLEYGKQRKCDIFSLIMVTPKRKEYLDFTKAYIQIPIVIATSIEKTFINDIASVLDKKLGIVKGYAYAELLRAKYPDINIVEVDSTIDGLNKVKSGEIFGYIGALSTVGYNIQKKFIGSVKIAGKFDETWNLGIGVRNDEKILVDIFNKAISAVSEKQHQEILNKWISVNYQKGMDYTLLWQITAAFFIVIAFILYNNLVTRKMNNKLEEANDKINNTNRKMEDYISIIDKNIITSSTDLDGNIIEVSQAFCDVSGYTKEELLGKSHNIIKHPDMDESIYEKLWEDISSGKTWQGEIKNKNKKGQHYWVDAKISPIFDNDGNIIRYTAIRQNITDKKKVEELSVTDQLTKLYNRVKLEETFIAEIQRAKRYNHPFSIILLDIDHFKLVNDTYGHDIGDETLKSLAVILKEHVRATDIVGRWGGEEFIIIASETNLDNTVKLAQKIRVEIEEFEFKEIGKKTASFGVSTFKDDDTPKSIVKRADEALYEAKEGGRNQVCVKI